MRTASMGPRVILMVVAVGVGLLPAWAKGAELGAPPGRCPGYVAHLQSARACLARGDRVAAAAELRQAEKALDSCIRSATEGGTVAEASAYLGAGLASTT